MTKGSIWRFVTVLGVFGLVWMAIRYLFPIFLPFFLGWVLACAAEPGVKFLKGKLRLPRGVASFGAVTLCLVLVTSIVWLLAAVCYREMVALAGGLPGAVEELSAGVGKMRDSVLSVAKRAPEPLAEPLERTVSDLFAGGSVLLEKAAEALFSAAGSVVGWLPGGALLVGTAVISAFMISAQMPALAAWVRTGSLWQRLEPQLSKLRKVILGWLRAQAKLSAVTLGIALAGFLLLRIEHAFLWAAVTALVDAVPMLGTGTVLIPMAVVAFLRGQSVRGIGLLGLYVTAMVTRSALEPRMVGGQLGMNPLLTLLALYAGYQIWGVPGMILSPILAVMAVQLAGAGD